MRNPGVFGAWLLVCVGADVFGENLFNAPLRINMGGIEVLDSKGSFWLGDGPGAGDPLEIRLDDLGGDQTSENWSLGAFVPESLAALGFDPGHPSDVYIFNTIRWDLGATPPNFLMEIPMEDGTYTVNVYFNEGFPSERHFQLTVQDALVDDDVSWRDSDPVSPLRGKVWVVTTEDVVVDDGILRIGLLPCPTCPGVTDMNPIVDAIEVLGTGGPVAPRFHRADSNADGIVNITDGIFVLNYLFLGGPAPSCIEAANANDDAVLNITDGIFILNYLFLGGPGPAPPGPVGQPCGSDPPGSPSDLGCIQYNNC